MSSLPVLPPSHAAAYFDDLASRYDDVWTNSDAGRLQRDAVWRQLDPLVRGGDRILDLGCGTGEDAVHFEALGGQVLALDVSPEMVRIARDKGVNARVSRIEDIHKFAVAFDMILSNFGGLNCVQDLSALRETLARLVRPQGFLSICVMSRFCLWETAHYTARGSFKKAVRRWSGRATTDSGLSLLYPSSGQVRRALSPAFDLVSDVGVGILVPPSFVGRVPRGLLHTLASVDAHIETSRIGRIIGDHRLLIFRRS
jgi:ubiquinone/menaquinone biosynthesis C-methylase UbiE